MTRAWLLALIAVRSLWAHKVKNAFVGSILAFSTFLVVLGSAVLDSVESSMQRAITSSLSGHLQVYSAKAKDPLALFGGFGGVQDIGEISEWAPVEEAIAGVPGVRAVVPMGLGFGTVFGRNEIDLALDDLRSAVDAGDQPGVAAGRDRVRRIAEDLGKSLETRRAIAREDVAAREAEAVERVRSDEFWAGFDADAQGSLEFLDTRLAPLASDGRLLYLRLVGTDLDQFATVFDRFHIVRGTAVPAGERGILISERTWEELVKNVVARQLDDVYQAVQDGATIAGDPLLQELIARNARQVPRVVYQLSSADAAALEVELRQKFPDAPPGARLEDLVQRLLQVDDATLADHHAFFYEHVAPRIKLYDLPLGGEMTLRSFTKSGYLRSVNVKIWGTYDSRGLERAGLQSAGNLVDLVTFRDLYGKMSDAQLAELEAIRTAAGVQEVDRASAEEALFGGGGEIVTEAVPATGALEVEVAARQDRHAGFDPADQHRGLALNGAVVLDDPGQITAVKAAIEKRLGEVGAQVQVVDWQAASGLLGQFIVVMRLVLYVSLFIVFLVAMIVVNNAMVMATMDRVTEIGTLRAIGAQRGTVVQLILGETLLLAVVAGAFGAALAVLTVTWFGWVGIPAGADVVVLLFAGPRLYPSILAGDVAGGMGIVLGVAMLSTLYPAALAAGVRPIVAMQGKE